MLQVCDTLWGTDRIIDDDPVVTVITDGFYLPYRSGGVWGIFGQDGQVVSSATDFRDGAQLSHNQLIDPLQISNYESISRAGGSFIYGGYINPHCGHFIINSLPRLWNIARIKTPGTKILCHGICPPKDWFGLPFIAAIMGALGLKLDDFVSPAEPLRLHALVVPGTSLHEQMAGHRIYGEFCRDIGRRLLHGRQATRGGRFAYFSKSRLKSAVGLIENEIEIENTLISLGVDIIYPESMPLREQIGVFLDYEYVLGTAGSFLHTSIFCKGSNIFCLNVTSQINTNYRIIDLLANNEAVYLYPPDIKVAPGRSDVLTTRYLPDADSVAREFFSIIPK